MKTKISKQTREFLESETGQMFMGLIMGNGTLTPYCLEHTQTSCYWEYSKSITKQFKNEYPQLLTPKISKNSFCVKERINRESLFVYKSQTLYTKRHSIFKELYTIFYPNGKKIIPMALVTKYFSKISLLYLYLDDGKVGQYEMLGLGLMCNFGEHELIKFQEFLTTRFHLEVTIQKKSKSKVLYIKTESSKHLLEQFRQMSTIVNSIGLIGETKLQLKKVDISNYIIRQHDVSTVL